MDEKLNFVLKIIHIFKNLYVCVLYGRIIETPK